MKSNFIKLFSLLAISGLLISCVKENTPPATPPKTRLELFTGVTWKYEEYHTGYNSSSPILAYKAGKANNTMDLTGDKVKYNTDGTVTEWLPDGSILPGTWHFLENETKYEVTNAKGTFLTTIVSVDEKNFFWMDTSPANRNGVYARMVPAQ